MVRLLITLQIAQCLDYRSNSPYIALETAIRVLRRTPGIIAIAFVAAGATVGVSDGGAEVAEDALKASGVGFAEEDVGGFDISVGDRGPVSLVGLFGVGASLVNAVVAVCNCVDEVVEEVPYEVLVEVGSCFLSTFDELVEGAFGAVLHIDCGFGVMFLFFDERIVIFDDIGMA